MPKKHLKLSDDLTETVNRFWQAIVENQMERARASDLTPDRMADLIAFLEKQAKAPPFDRSMAEWFVEDGIIRAIRVELKQRLDKHGAAARKREERARAKAGVKPKHQPIVLDIG